MAWLFFLGGWCCSYHWIKRKGKLAPREIAPIVVSNHVSYIDPIFYFFEFFPTIVASDSHDAMPLVGTIIRAMQVIGLYTITLGAVDSFSSYLFLPSKFGFNYHFSCCAMFAGDLCQSVFTIIKEACC